MSGRTALEFMHLADSLDLGERIIGVATINALSEIVFRDYPDRYLLEKKNLIDVLKVDKKDTVVLVGLIQPFVPVLKSKSKKLYILERRTSTEEEALPDTADEDTLPKADVVIITGSTVANGTIDKLLELSSHAKTVALVGPTASFVPEPLFRRAVNYIGGMRILNPDKTMQIIREGGGTPQLKQVNQFVTYKRDDE